MPCAVRRSSVVLCCVIVNGCEWMDVDPSLPIHPTLPSRLGVHAFILCVCVSVSALQIDTINI